MIKSILIALLSLASAAAFAAVDVNKGGIAELEAVKGIGPSMAARIVDARKSGPFASWADLSARVKGVSQGNAAKFSSQGLTVGGSGFVASAALPTKTKAKRRGATQKL